MTIWHLSIDGTPPTITSEFAWECPHCWPLKGMISPDLSWIAYPKMSQPDEYELHVAKIDGTEGVLVSGFGDGDISSINWAPDSDRLAVGMRSGLNSLYLVQVENGHAVPVSDAIVEDVSWIDSSHFFYHTGNHDHPVLSIGTVGGTSEAIIESDNDPNALTRFIIYDFTK